MLMLFLPSEEFKALIGHSSHVSKLSSEEFDPQGQYKAVLEVVAKSGDDEPIIFRVELGTRVEYYIVVYDQKGNRVVGLRAKAVES